VCISKRKKDKKRIPVSVIMSKDIVILNHTDDLVIAEKLFKEHQIRHIPVVNGESIIGIFSYDVD
jgi:CBS domain-containing membrane protein